MRRLACSVEPIHGGLHSLHCRLVKIGFRVFASIQQVIVIKKLDDVIQLGQGAGKGGDQRIDMHQTPAGVGYGVVIYAEFLANPGDVNRLRLAGSDIKQHLLQIAFTIYGGIDLAAVFASILDHERASLESLGDTLIGDDQSPGDALAQANHGKPEALVLGSGEQHLHLASHPGDSFHTLADVATTQRELGHFQVQRQHHIGATADLLVTGGTGAGGDAGTFGNVHVEEIGLWTRLFTQPPTQVIDVLLQSLPRVLPGALGMGEIGRQHLQGLHQTTQRQLATLARHLVLVDVVETALHLQGEHLALAHTQHTQGRGDLVDSPHALQQGFLVGGIIAVLHQRGLCILGLLVHQPENPFEGDDIRFA